MKPAFPTLLMLLAASSAPSSASSDSQTWIEGPTGATALFAPMPVEVNGKRMILAEMVVKERHQPPPRAESCPGCGTPNPKTHACPSCVRYVPQPAVTTEEPNLMAFDPDAGLPMWNLPVPVYGDASYAVQGAYLVVAHHGATVYSLTNGEIVTTLSVPDTSVEVCATHQNRVLVTQSGNGRAVAIELGSWEMSPARVQDCSHSDRRVLPSPDDTNQISVRGVAADDRHYGRSATPRAYLADGQNAVLLGLRASGRLPLLVGLDPKSKRERWRALVPSDHPEDISPLWMGLHFYGVRDANWVLALGDGRAIVEYGDWLESTRLTAFDAKTGRRIWDVELPGGEFHAFSAAFGHIYVYDKELVLRILDPTSGKPEL